MTRDSMPALPQETRIVEIVWSLYAEYTGITSEKPDLTAQAKEQTRLFGTGAKLDSLGLVNLLLDVERQVNSEFDVLISLMDERAMSQKNSPFRTIETLGDYIETLIDEEQG